MKKLFVKLFVVVALLLALLSVFAAGSGQAHALVACPFPLHLSCAGHGGIVCVDRHGHHHRFHGHVPTGWHCVAI